MNYHTNYLLNATISLPLSLSSSLILPLSGTRDAQSQANGEYCVRGGMAGVHDGSTLKLKLPSKRCTFFSGSCLSIGLRPHRTACRHVSTNGGGRGAQHRNKREQYVVNIAHFRYFISGDV